MLATILLETVGSLHWGRSITVWPAMLAAALTVGSIYIAPAAGNVQRPYARAEPIVQSLLAQLRQSDQPDGPALIRPWGGTMIGVAAAMVDQMLHEGRPVYVDRSLGYEVGYGHTAQLSQVRWVLFVIENSAIYNIARSLPGTRVVAVDHPIPSTQMDELAQVQDRVMSQLRADGFQGDYQVLGAPLVALLLGNQPGVSASDLHELSRLNAALAAHGCLCSVIEFPSNPGLTFQPGYMASVVSGRPGPNANPR